jgi:MoaA/NifB/PqqE/SkfB family radical SAM enzyme
MFENIKAIRSLQCQDHAINLPPNVLTVLWFLGKKCNYDCSYCSPHTHDAVSPFVDPSQSQKFISTAVAWAYLNNKKIKWAFTGGEPFLDTALLSIVKTLSDSSTTEQINITTNGSLPLSHYEKFSGLVAGITFSVHLERSTIEIQKTIDTMIELTRQQKIFVSCNLMFLPGKQKEIEEIVLQLQQHQVNFVLRKISPNPNDESFTPFVDPNKFKKSLELKSVDQQGDSKQKWRSLRDQQLTKLSQSYYSAQELEYLKTINTQPVWQNIGLWHGQDQYTEVNTDLLLSLGKAQFQNWMCYAGVDNMYVDFDGCVYRGLCQEGGKIGHISDWSGFLTQPVTCNQNHCGCNQDIAVRKSRDAETSRLINGQI